MALDATGTPTTKFNLPKYNTSVDAPTGKGFNAAMDAIDSALGTLGVYDISKGASAPTGGGTASRTAIQTAINTAFAAGGGRIFLPKGTWLLDTQALAIPRNNTGIAAPLVICGAGRGLTTIKLTSASKGLAVPTKVADGDIFRDIYFEDFTLDADNLQTFHHMLFGTYVPGNVTEVNFDTIAIRRVNIINAYTDNAGHANAVNMGVGMITNAAASGTNRYTKRILIEDYRQEGGTQGITIAGSNTTGSPYLLNVDIDDVTINRASIIQGQRTVSQADNGIHVGSLARVGRLRVNDCYVENAPDTGYEINNTRDGVIDGCVARDCVNFSYLCRNFVPQTSIESQHTTFNNCRAEAFNITTTAWNAVSTINKAFGVTNDNSELVHKVSFNDCSVYRNSPVWYDLDFWIFDGTGGELPIRNLTINNFDSVTNVTAADTGVRTPSSFTGKTAASANPTVEINGYRIRRTGTVGTGAKNAFGISLGGTQRFVIRDVTADYNVSGIASGTLSVVEIGGTAASAGRGYIKNISLINKGSFATATNLTIYSGVTYTIASPGIFYENIAGTVETTTISKGGQAAVFRMLDEGYMRLLDPTSTLGYGVGAGGSVTQLTSKAQGVTLNKPTGQITLNNAALAATTTVTFTVTNSVVTALDTVRLSIASGNATAGTYQVWEEGVAAGSFKVNVRNMSAGSLSEALVINFNVIKGQTS